MFLKLHQPIEDMQYPTPRVLEVGRSYLFPFIFVVPDRLLPQACTHPRINAHTHRAHTMLPPTLGDLMLAGNGKTFMDDMAPDMSRISYIIRVGVLEQSSTDYRQLEFLANLAKKVRIIPTVEEEPPINVLDYPYYCTRKEKSGRRGFLRGKLGRLVISSSQPKPIRLLPPRHDACESVNTVATVQLRFDPVDNEQPPRLRSMTSSLNASTFYSATPWEDFPCPSGTMSFSQAGKGLFVESIPLLTMCVASAQWEKHSTSYDSNRHDSVPFITSADSADPSAAYLGDTYYTASVVIPVTLPNSKTFVPTFHSCMISRIYSLDLSLTYDAPRRSFLAPAVSLRLPIQITT